MVVFAYFLGTNRRGECGDGSGSTYVAGNEPAIFDKQKFWEDSLAIIGKRIERFCEI